MKNRNPEITIILSLKYIIRRFIKCIIPLPIKLQNKEFTSAFNGFIQCWTHMLMHCDSYEAYKNYYLLLKAIYKISAFISFVCGWSQMVVVITARNIGVISRKCHDLFRRLDFFHLKVLIWYLLSFDLKELLIFNQLGIIIYY